MRSSIIGQQIAAMESAAFQSATFFRELTGIFAELQALKREEIGDSEAAGRLSKVIRHHTGLDVTVEIGERDASVDIPAVDKNNPLIAGFIRNFLSSSDGLKMIDNAGGVCHGTVNILTGKVSGVFCDVKHTVYLPMEMFFTNKKYSPEEIAAVTLHEIGHLFTYYEFITRSVTTNQVLAGVSKALDGSAAVDERVAVLKRAKKELKLKQLDEHQLAKSRNNRIVEVVLVSQIVKECRSELGSNLYDMNSWEMLADQYATRMGAGPHVVTALDKIYRGSWNISFRSSAGFYFFEAFKLLNIVLAGIALSGVLGPVGFVAGYIHLINCLVLVANDSEPELYNTPGARFKRVRDQIVVALKVKKLTPADREKLEADLEEIDKIAKEVNDRRQLLGVIIDFVSPHARKERNQMLLQQELENLAANDLFVKAGQLRQLA